MDKKNVQATLYFIWGLKLFSNFEHVSDNR